MKNRAIFSTLSILVIIALIAVACKDPTPAPSPVIQPTAQSNRETRLVALKVDNTLVVGDDTVLEDVYATGNATVAGVVTATGGFVGSLSLPAAISATSLNVSGATVLNGGLAMDSNKFTVADATGNTVIAGTLGVTGDSTFTGDISTRNITATGTISTAAATHTGALNMSNYVINNIGNSATDFNSRGGLVLAEGLTVTSRISVTGGYVGKVISGTVSDNGVIAHGLGAAPSYAMCSAYATNLFTYTVYVSGTMDATNITIGFGDPLNNTKAPGAHAVSCYVVP